MTNNVSSTLRLMTANYKYLVIIIIYYCYCYCYLRGCGLIIQLCLSMVKYLDFCEIYAPWNCALILLSTCLYLLLHLFCSFWRARYRRPGQRKTLWKLVHNQRSLFTILLLVKLLILFLFKYLTTEIGCIVFLRTATKVTEMLGNVNTSSALSAFEKMEEKGTSFLKIKTFPCQLYTLPWSNI